MIRLEIKGEQTVKGFGAMAMMLTPRNTPLSVKRGMT